MEGSLSVIICAHNPRSAFLERTLGALQAQTLPKEEWEFLLIDNASKEPLASKWDLSWHPRGHHIKEDETGLTPARLRGIREARGELIVFVDDDNILAPDYLENAKKIADKHAFLGSWGAGIIEPEFESKPPGWMGEYFSLMALRHVSYDRWSNITDSDITMPYGAGLCVRTDIARIYSRSIENDSFRRGLGRIGKNLGGAEDFDLSMTSVDQGFQIGLFTSLRMIHLIPAARTQEAYLLRLMEGCWYSNFILDASRGRPPRAKKISGWRKVLGKMRRLVTMLPRRRRFLEAQIRGYQRALKDLELLNRNGNGKS